MAERVAESANWRKAAIKILSDVRIGVTSAESIIIFEQDSTSVAVAALSDLSTAIWLLICSTFLFDLSQPPPPSPHTLIFGPLYRTSTPAQITRARNQFGALESFYSAFSDFYPGNTLEQCAEIAARSSMVSEANTAMSWHRGRSAESFRKGTSAPLPPTGRLLIDRT